MRAAVHLQQHAFLGHALAALTVPGWPVPARRFQARLAPDTLDAFAAEHNALTLRQELGQVVVVAAGVRTSKQLSHPRPGLLADPPWR
jgi:hypothetical protein